MNERTDAMSRTIVNKLMRYSGNRSTLANQVMEPDLPHPFLCPIKSSLLSFIRGIILIKYAEYYMNCMRIV